MGVMENSGEDYGGGGGGRWLLWLFVFAFIVGLGLFAAYELTNHLGDVRPGETETRLEAWLRIEDSIRNRPDNDGEEVYAASCMLSKVRSKGSKYLGEPNPHFKIAVCRSGICDYAIIGVLFEEAAVVTARSHVPLSAYKSEVRKDFCVSVPVEQVLDVLDGRMPLP